MSAQLHRWIDLTFGHQLSGKAAMAAKNVTLPSIDPERLQSVGRAQLFWTPHPPRDAAVLKQVQFKCHDMPKAAPAGKRCPSRPTAQCRHAVCRLWCLWRYQAAFGCKLFCVTDAIRCVPDASLSMS